METDIETAQSQWSWNFLDRLYYAQTSNHMQELPYLGVASQANFTYGSSQLHIFRW